MKILCTGIFYPRVGGMERLLEVIAGEFVARGHEVQIATLSDPPRPEQARSFRYPVWWRPSARRVFALQRWADVALHFGLGLRLGWPALLARTPQVVSHQFPYGTSEREKRGREFFKNWLTRWVTNISASRAIAESIPGVSTLIPNCYDDAVFGARGDEARPRDFAFVGRLVSLKGVDHLLDALAMMDGNKARPNLTIVGDGPERAALEQRARPLGSRVTFLGTQTPGEIATILREHRVLVVPSRWNEPFGIVALEGIACGCVVVGSAGGGLPDAIGPCGLTYPNGDVAALSLAMGRALEDAAWRARACAAASAHLRVHTVAAVAARYENALSLAVNRRGVSDRPPRKDDRAGCGRASLVPRR